MEWITKDKGPIIKEFIESSYNNFNDFLSENKQSMSFSEEETKQLSSEKEFIDRIRDKDPIKNQHYVPQFYLRLFKNKTWRIETFDTKKNQILQIICKIWFCLPRSNNPSLYKMYHYDLF